MIYLKNPLCLGMEESEYKEMRSLGGMRQKHFEKNEVILSAGCTTHVHKFYRVRHPLIPGTARRPESRSYRKR